MDKQDRYSSQRSPSRFHRVIAQDASGDKLVKELPRKLVVPRAKLGMAINNTSRGDVGVIIAMTWKLCIYETPDGEEQTAPWHCITLDGVEPDPLEVQPARLTQELID